MDSTTLGTVVKGIFDAAHATAPATANLSTIDIGHISDAAHELHTHIAVDPSTGLGDFRGSSPISGNVASAEKYGQDLQKMKASGSGVSTATIEAFEKAGVNHGPTAHGGLDHLSQQVTIAKGDFTQVKQELQRLQALETTGSATHKQFGRAIAHVESLETGALNTLTTQTERVVSGSKGKLQTAGVAGTTPASTTPGSSTPAAELSDAARAAAQTPEAIERAVTAKLAGSVADKAGLAKRAIDSGIIGKDAYEAKGKIGKLWAGVKANIGISDITHDASGAIQEVKQAGWFGKKGAKVAANVGSVIVAGFGLRDAGRLVGLVAPEVDQNGKEVAPDAGLAIKAAAELGAAAATTYFTVIRHGAAKAQGIKF